MADLIGEPPDPFVDRKSLIRSIVAELDAANELGRSCRINVYGFAGHGRTSAVLKLFESVRSRFPDDSCELSLTSEDGRPKSPGEAYGELLVWLGVPAEQLPAADGERAIRYRSLVAGRRFVLVLDDVITAEQVEPLIPGQGAMVVVISKRPIERLGLHGFRSMLIGVLDDQAATELFEKLLQSVRDRIDDATIAALVRACGGHALAIKIVGTLLARRPERAEHFLRRFGEQGVGAFVQDGVPVLAHCFDTAYDDLPAEDARAYRLLTLHPGDEFTALAAAQLLGRDGYATLDVLDRLVDAQLLTTASDRYRYHELARVDATARRQAADSPAECADLERALIGWYLRQAAAHDRALTDRWRVAPVFAEVEPATKSGAAALVWLAAERENVVAAARRAVELGLDELVWQFPIALWGILHRRGLYDIWLDLHRLALDAVERVGNQAGRMQLLSQLGTAHLRLGELDAAEQCFRASLQIAEEIGHGLGRQSALEWLGQVALRRGDPETACRLYDQSWEVTLTAVPVKARPRAFALLHMKYARAHNVAGRFAEAREHAEQGLAFFADGAESDNHAKMRWELAKALRGVGRPAEALPVFQQAADILAGDNSVESLARVFEDLAATHESCGSRRLAVQYYEQAEQRYRSIGHPRADEVRAIIDRLGD